MNQTSMFDNRFELLSNIESNKEKIFESQQLWNHELTTYLTKKYVDQLAIFIPGDTPSLKNSKEISVINTKYSECCNGLMEKLAVNNWICGTCKRPAKRKKVHSLRSSDQVLEYKKVTEYVFNTNTHRFNNMVKDVHFPLHMGFYFVRRTKASFDYVNMCQVLLDLMKDHRSKDGHITKKWIKDDNMFYVIPYFLGYHHNPKKPGAMITLMDDTLFNLIKNNHASSKKQPNSETHS